MAQQKTLVHLVSISICHCYFDGPKIAQERMIWRNIFSTHRLDFSQVKPASFSTHPPSEQVALLFKFPLLHVTVLKCQILMRRSLLICTLHWSLCDRLNCCFSCVTLMKNADCAFKRYFYVFLRTLQNEPDTCVSAF